MIELNSKTQQDFLNRKWVQKLLEAGVDMSDAKYYISYEDSPTEDRSINCIRLKSELKDMDPDSVKIAMSMGAFARRGYIKYEFDTLPTYTVSELLYKLHEWIYPTIICIVRIMIQGNSLMSSLRSGMNLLWDNVSILLNL